MAKKISKNKAFKIGNLTFLIIALIVSVALATSAKMLMGRSQATESATKECKNFDEGDNGVNDCYCTETNCYSNYDSDGDGKIETNGCKKGFDNECQNADGWKADGEPKEKNDGSKPTTWDAGPGATCAGWDTKCVQRNACRHALYPEPVCAQIGWGQGHGYGIWKGLSATEIIPNCNQACVASDNPLTNCPSELTCVKKSLLLPRGGKICRNPNCPEDNTCLCENNLTFSVPSPIPTTKPTFSQYVQNLGFSFNTVSLSTLVDLWLKYNGLR